VGHLFRRHALVVLNAVAGDFAEVTLPLTSWTLLLALVAEALGVERCRAIVTADQFTSATTNGALVCITVRHGLYWLLWLLWLCRCSHVRGVLPGTCLATGYHRGVIYLSSGTIMVRGAIFLHR
jgi:hypothetical protein